MDTHKPSVVTLLETRMVSHAPLLNDYDFTNMIEVPAEGQAGGLVILWNNSSVNVHSFTRQDQAIHAMIEVIVTKKTWLFCSIYASTSVTNRNNLWNNLTSWLVVILTMCLWIVIS